MHNPRPYGRFIEDTQLTIEDAAEVELLARQLTNFKAISELDSLKRVRTLPSGRQAIAVDMGGVFRILITEVENKLVFDGIAKLYIPMLFSGVITKAVVPEDKGVGLRLTRQTQLRLNKYVTRDLPENEVELMRFKIEYPLAFYYFKPETTASYAFTQYAKLRPTWYSGAMTQVMQIVGGYGKQGLSGLPDDPIERAQMIIPDQYMDHIKEELNRVRLPAFNGFPDYEGQFQYDYKFSTCHAISFDSTNKPWLVQVNGSGVHVMPLPVVPATTTVAFRQYIEEVQDEEILTILDRFGGLPSGEGFPKGRDFQAWRRAGVIIKVCDTADFYQHQPFYTACGWAFNSTGQEGFNTCWSYNGAGLIYSYAYKLTLKLASAPNHGLLQTSWKFKAQRDAELVNGYLEQLFQLITDNGARELAIRYKIGRQTESEILDRAKLLNIDQREVDYWDNLEMKPIAQHTGYMRQVAMGPVYWPLKNPRSMGRLKFPELMGQGCESFIMVSPEYKGGAVKCDTIVFGCYVNDQLQVIKYFFDEQKFTRTVESTFEDIMIVGEWEKTETTGNSGLMGHFYTSDFDDRQEVPEVSTYTKITGTDLGYGQPAYQTPYLFSCVGSLSRSRYYKYVTKIKTTKGMGIDVAVCVPVFMRDCILYAYQQTTTEGYESEEGVRKSISDPTSYQLWCYDSIFHYLGQTQSGNKGHPTSKDGTPVYVDTLTYSPTDYSDFADSGNWFNFPVGGFIDVTSVCGPYTSRSSGHFQATGVVIGGKAPDFKPYSIKTELPGESSGRVHVSMAVAGSRIVHRHIPQPWYYAYSPEDDLYFYRDACMNAIGDTEYANISETDMYARRYRWGQSSLINHQAAYHFIGVINE